MKVYHWCKSKREPCEALMVETQEAVHMKTTLSNYALKHTALTSGSSSLCGPVSCLSICTCTLANDLTAGHRGKRATADCAGLRAGWEVPHTVPASAALPNGVRACARAHALARAHSCFGICPGSGADCLGARTCTRAPAAHRAADLHRQAEVPASGAARANPGCFSARTGVQPGVHVQQQHSGHPCRPGHHI